MGRLTPMAKRRHPSAPSLLAFVLNHHYTFLFVLALIGVFVHFTVDANSVAQIFACRVAFMTAHGIVLVSSVDRVLRFGGSKEGSARGWTSGPGCSVHGGQHFLPRIRQARSNEHAFGVHRAVPLRVRRALVVGSCVPCHRPFLPCAISTASRFS